MPRVPVYQGQRVGPGPAERIAALPEAYQDIRTNVEMFGAGQARALEAAGIGLGNLSDTIGAIAEERLVKANEAAAGKARAALNDYITESLYGPEGFMGREGEAAVGAYPRQQTDFDRRVRELQDGLPTAEAQRRFRETTQEQVFHAQRAMAQHVGSQRESVHARIADTELASATGLALKGYADPEMLKQALAEGAGVIRRHNAARGLPDEVSADQIAGFAEGVFDQIVGRVAKEDPALIAALGGAPLTGEAVAGDGVSETSVPSEAPLWWQGASAAARGAALASAERQIGDQRLMFRTDVNQRVKTEIRHHRAGLAVPSDTPVTRADIDAAYPPDQALRFWEDLQQDRAFGDLMRAVAMRGPAGLQAMLEDARSMEGNRRQYHQLLKAFVLDRQAREEDPAGYVIERTPGLQAAWAMEGPDGGMGELTPDEMRSAMQATWEAQAEIGVPVSDRRAMTDAAATAFANLWLKEADPEARLDSLMTITQPLDETGPQTGLAEQLIEAGLPRGISVALDIAEDPLRRHAAVAVLRALADPVPALSDVQQRHLYTSVQSQWRQSPALLRRLKAALMRDHTQLTRSADEGAVLNRMAKQAIESSGGATSAAAEAAAVTLFGSSGKRGADASVAARELVAASGRWERRWKAAEPKGQLAELSRPSSPERTYDSLRELLGMVSQSGVTLPELLGLAQPSPAPSNPEPEITLPELLGIAEPSPAATGEAGDGQPERQPDIAEEPLSPAIPDSGTGDAMVPAVEVDETVPGVGVGPTGDESVPAERRQTMDDQDADQPDYPIQPWVFRHIPDEELLSTLEIDADTPGIHDPRIAPLLREMLSLRGMSEEDRRDFRMRVGSLRREAPALALALDEVWRTAVAIVEDGAHRFPALMSYEELLRQRDLNKAIASAAGAVSIVPTFTEGVRYGLSQQTRWKRVADIARGVGRYTTAPSLAISAAAFAVAWHYNGRMGFYQAEIDRRVAELPSPTGSPAELTWPPANLSGPTLFTAVGDPGEWFVEPTDGDLQPLTRIVRHYYSSLGRPITEEQAADWVKRTVEEARAWDQSIRPLLESRLPDFVGQLAPPDDGSLPPVGTGPSIEGVFIQPPEDQIRWWGIRALLILNDNGINITEADASMMVERWIDRALDEDKPAADIVSQELDALHRYWIGPDGGSMPPFGATPRYIEPTADERDDLVRRVAGQMQSNHPYAGHAPDIAVQLVEEAFDRILDAARRRDVPVVVVLRERGLLAD